MTQAKAINILHFFIYQAVKLKPGSLLFLSNIPDFIF